LTGKGAAAEDCSSRQDNQLSIDWNGCGFYRREAVMDHSEESQHDPQITSRHSLKNREYLANAEVHLGGCEWWIWFSDRSFLNSEKLKTEGRN